jgi:hypothetical protein
VICPQCNKTPRCTDSRQRGPTRWRRYVCECGYRFSTEEAITGSKADRPAADPEPAPAVDTSLIDALETLTDGFIIAIAAFQREKLNR